MHKDIDIVLTPKQACIASELKKVVSEKSRIKEIKRVLLDTDKQLLKIIGENEELKLRFNNEVQK